jgi:hypothetical protein
MTQSTIRLGHTTRPGVFAAMLALIGVMASMQPARAADPQVSEAAQDDEINRQAAGLGDAVPPRPGPYASARHDRRSETLPAPRKDFQDIK